MESNLWNAEGIRNIVNKSSSSKNDMIEKSLSCSRRDMQTVEFGNIQTLTKSNVHILDR